MLFATLLTVWLWTTAVQPLFEQSWNSSVPLSVAPGSEKVADSCGGVCARAVTEAGPGAVGAIVS